MATPPGRSSRKVSFLAEKNIRGPIWPCIQYRVTGPG